MPRSLSQEIGKRRPFELAEEEAYLNLVKTSNQLAGPIKAFFKSHALSDASYNVLRILRGSGERACSEIGRDMVVRVPDVTRLVDRLETQGLVERDRDSEDRRVVLVRLTRKGSRLLASIDAPLADLHKASMAHMTKAELKALSKLLVKLRSAPDAS